MTLKDFQREGGVGGGEGEGYVYLMISFDVGCFMFLSVGYNCIPSQSGLLGISF